MLIKIEYDRPQCSTANFSALLPPFLQRSSLLEPQNMAVASIERLSSLKSSVLKEEYDSRHHEKDLPIPNIASGDESGFWKTFAAAPDNETQRGMHSRHLMMIGGSDLSPRE